MQQHCLHKRIPSLFYMATFAMGTTLLQTSPQWVLMMTVFVWSVIITSSDGVTSHPAIQRLFFVAQAEDCAVNRTLLQHWVHSGVLSQNEHDAFETTWLHKTARQRRRRLKQCENEEDSTRDGPAPPRRRLLVEQDTYERRDAAIAALDTLYHHRMRQRGRATTNDSKRRFLSAERLEDFTVSTTYLPGLHMDFIDNHLLPDDELFHAATQLPCLLYPPEKDQPRFPIMTNISLFDSPITAPNLTSDTEKTYALPNDPMLPPAPNFIGQWHLGGPGSPVQDAPYGINAFEAWSIYRGQEAQSAIGVVDTGCSMHPDLEFNLCKEEDDCAGQDFGDGAAHPFQEPLSAAQGTTVASAIAGTTNNNYMTSGVCWGCKVSCLKVYNERANSLLSSALLLALEYMLIKRIRISNHSYVGYKQINAEIAALTKLRNMGHIIVASAGDDACNVDDVYPVSPDGCRDKYGRRRKHIVPIGYNLDNIIGVGATDADGNKASFSSWGPRNVNIMAPGVHLVLPYNTRVVRSGVASVSGTAVATALVTGVVALVWSSKPELRYNEVIDIVLGTAARKKTLAGLCQTSGIVDAGAAIKSTDGFHDSPELRVFPFPTSDNTVKYYSAGEPSGQITAAAVLVLLGSGAVLFRSVL